MQESILFVVTGPSGSGKGTIMRAIVKRYSDIIKIATFTTRAPRANEEHGFDYNFVPQARFLEKVQAGEIAEWEQVYQDHYYGSPSFDPNAGPDRLMELDYKGMFKYKKLAKRLVSIFVAPPSLDEMVERIQKRSTEANLANRVNNAIEQLCYAQHYDYIIINGEMEEACAEAVAIVGAERARRDHGARIAALNALCLNSPQSISARR
jgi:guanylate kinase